MVHRTDFLPRHAYRNGPVSTSFSRRRRLREAALIIAFACAALLLCVSVGLGLWDIVLAILHHFP